MGRETGGLVVAFAGAVLLILAVKGTLGDVWGVLTGHVALTKDAKGNVTGATTTGLTTGGTTPAGVTLGTTNAAGQSELVSFTQPIGTPGSGVAPDAVPVPGSIA